MKQLFFDIIWDFSFVICKSLWTYSKSCFYKYVTVCSYVTVVFTTKWSELKKHWCISFSFLSQLMWYNTHDEKLLASVQKSFHSKKAFIIFVVLKTAVTEIKPIYCFDGSTKKLKCMATFLELDHHAKSSNKNQIVGHFSNIASKKVCDSTVLLIGFMFTLKFLKFSKSQHCKKIYWQGLTLKSYMNAFWIYCI